MEFHPLCLLLSYREEVVDELAEIMSTHGWYPQEHITLYDGQILDGRHRYLAAQKANVEFQFMDFVGDKDAAIAFVFGANAMSRHFSNADKKDFFLNARNSGFWEKRDSHRPDSKGGDLPPSHQDIADILGVNKSTVKGWESERTNPSLSIRADTSGNDEWYTPAKYIDMAREVMGGIDVDPAGCEISQKVVQAPVVYTIDDSGLDHSWQGRVWLNPPYSKGLIDQFVAKLRKECLAGHTTQAIALAHNFTDTGWFHALAAQARVICFTRGRIKFYTVDGVGNSPTSGHTFFYFGKNVNAFIEKFSEIGLICIPNGRP